MNIPNIESDDGPWIEYNWPGPTLESLPEYCKKNGMNFFDDFDIEKFICKHFQKYGVTLPEYSGDEYFKRWDEYIGKKYPENNSLIVTSNNIILFDSKESAEEFFEYIETGYENEEIGLEDDVLLIDDSGKVLKTV